ncbi:50S ribosomal protein L29 [candidate division WOR-3 bacterium]|nr:50S ribosomal protein L29 [candidate division WOR-3 bacterium]
MNAKELRELTDEELSSKLHDFREELFTLRFQKVLGNLQSPSQFTKLKREIARILTVMKEKGKKI